MSDVVWSAAAPEWERGALRRRVVGRALAGVLRGADGARRDGVDADARAPELERRGAHEGEHPCLRRRVRRAERHRAQSRERRDVHDAAAIALRDQLSRHGPRGQERRLQVEPHHRVPRLGWRGHEREPLVLDTAGNVHETVERAGTRDLANGRMEALRIAHVDDPRAAGAADSGDGLFGVGETVGVDVERRDRGAALREHPAHRSPDPATAGARDDDRAAVEPEPFRDHAHIVADDPRACVIEVSPTPRRRHLLAGR